MNGNPHNPLNLLFLVLVLVFVVGMATSDVSTSEDDDSLGIVASPIRCSPRRHASASFLRKKKSQIDPKWRAVSPHRKERVAKTPSNPKASARKSSRTSDSKKSSDSKNSVPDPIDALSRMFNAKLAEVHEVLQAKKATQTKQSSPSAPNATASHVDSLDSDDVTAHGKDVTDDGKGQSLVFEITEIVLLPERTPLKSKG